MRELARSSLKRSSKGDRIEDRGRREHAEALIEETLQLHAIVFANLDPVPVSNRISDHGNSNSVRLFLSKVTPWANFSDLTHPN